MLHLNKAIIPDPDAPVVFDAHGGEAGPELVVIAVDNIQYHERTVVTCAFRGSIVDVRGDRLAAVLVSAGLRPLGRLERRERGVKPRLEGFDLTGAVNDLGPRLRALREQTGLRIGELARALGCPLPNLSRVELGEWVLGASGLVQAIDAAEAENELMLRVLRIARAVNKALYDANHPVWPNQGTIHIIKGVLMQELRTFLAMLNSAPGPTLNPEPAPTSE